MTDDNGPIKVSINGEAPTGYASGKSGTFKHSVHLDKAGAHTFTATATDDAGRTSTSAPVTIYKDGDSAAGTSSSSKPSSSGANNNSATSLDSAKTTNSTQSGDPKTGGVLGTDAVNGAPAKPSGVRLKTILIIVLLSLLLIGATLALLVKRGILKLNTPPKRTKKPKVSPQEGETSEV